MRRFLFLPILGCLAVSQPAIAQPVSGNSLYEACTSDDQVQTGFCVGYLIGQIEGQFLGGLLVTQRAGKEVGFEDFNGFANQIFQHCIPPDASNGQLRDVVVAYLRDNPANRHETARFLVWSAYRDAFPCP